MVLDSKQMDWASREGLDTAALKRAKVPIFVEDAVLDQAGMVFESEGEADEAAPEGRQAPAEVIDESKLGVFKEFIETLDLGDLGRGGGEKPERM